MTRLLVTSNWQTVLAKMEISQCLVYNTTFPPVFIFFHSFWDPSKNKANYYYQPFTHPTGHSLWRQVCRVSSAHRFHASGFISLDLRCTHPLSLWRFSFSLQVLCTDQLEPCAARQTFASFLTFPSPLTVGWSHVTSAELLEMTHQSREETARHIPAFHCSVATDALAFVNWNSRATKMES